MSIVEWIAAAVQKSDSESLISDPATALYFVIAILAAVLGLVVLIFVRTSMRRSARPGAQR
jgi:hypothetical protein